MIKLDDKSEYKQKTMIELISDDDIVSLINQPKYADDPSELIWKYIFPYIRISETQEEAATFILLEVNTPKVSTVNRFFKDMLLTVGILTHAEWMKTPYGGTRNDLISGIIIDKFNGNRDVAGNELDLVSDVASVLIGGKYHYRELRFVTQGMTRNPCND